MKKMLVIILTLALISRGYAQSEDEIAIKKVVTNFEQSFNKKDATLAVLR